MSDKFLIRKLRNIVNNFAQPTKKMGEIADELALELQTKIYLALKKMEKYESVFQGIIDSTYDFNSEKLRKKVTEEATPILLKVR